MFLTTPAPAEATQRLHDSIAAAQGFAMNLGHAWSWRPDVFEAFAALRAKLTSASSLSQVGGRPQRHDPGRRGGAARPTGLKASPC